MKASRNEKDVASILAIDRWETNFVKTNSVGLVQVRTKIFVGRGVSFYSWL